MIAPFQQRLFTRAEYHAMAEAGILHPEDRVELIEGMLVQMAPVGNWHVRTVRTLTGLLAAQVAGQAEVDVQNAIVLGESEPLPDLVIVRLGVSGKAEAGDILLIIEVSDSTLAYDRDRKAGLYAQYAIPELWIVDHQHARIIQYTDPNEGEYHKSQLYTRGQSVTSTITPNVTVVVDVLFGES